MRTITVDVNIDDLINDIDDKDLVKEIIERDIVDDVIEARYKKASSPPEAVCRSAGQPTEADLYDEWCDELRGAIACGDLLHVDVLLARQRPFVPATDTGLLTWRRPGAHAVERGLINHPPRGSA